MSFDPGSGSCYCLIVGHIINYKTNKQVTGTLPYINRRLTNFRRFGHNLFCYAGNNASVSTKEAHCQNAQLHFAAGTTFTPAIF